MHCKKKGELYDGYRHETRKYGPDLDVSNDEMTLGTYWKRAMSCEMHCTSLLRS